MDWSQWWENNWLNVIGLDFGLIGIEFAIFSYFNKQDRRFPYQSQRKPCLAMPYYFAS
jgi:hypothetical protein